MKEKQVTAKDYAKMKTKKDSPMADLQDSGLMFDPMAQHLDLTKEEKRRTTALFLAINAYSELIIKDAAYLREMNDIARRGEGPKICRLSVH